MSLKDYRKEIEEQAEIIINKPEVIQAALQVRLNHPGDHKYYWGKYEKIIGDEFDKLGYNQNDAIVMCYGILGENGKWTLDKIVTQEYIKLDMFHPIPMDNSVETELNLEDCYIEFWFDKEEKKPKINKKTGMRKPEATKFVMPL